MKTNAMRLLDKAGADYSAHTYEWDEDSLDAISVAHKLNIEPQRMFKTLVLSGTQLKHFVVVIPGDARLDLKSAARASGNKSCSMLALKQLLGLTGYQHGGCSPLAMKKTLPCFIDERALEYDEISVSGGLRGLQIYINPRVLAKLIPAEFKRF